MRVSSASSFFVLALLGASPVVAASASQELRGAVNILSPVITQDKEDQDSAIAQGKLDAKADLFPDDGTDYQQGRQSSSVGPEAFVTFRLNGVPYALTDVSSQAWFAPYVRDMADRGIVTGYRDAQGVPTGIFGPERNVTVEELAKMAVEAAQIDKTSCGEAKNPLVANRWSAPYVACAEHGSFALFADGGVDVLRPATRAEVVMTVVQAFGAQIKDVSGDEKIFTDVTASTLFSSAIKTAVADGVVSGFSDANGNPTGYFGPEKNVNRAEVSKMLSVAVQVYGKR